MSDRDDLPQALLLRPIKRDTYSSDRSSITIEFQFVQWDSSLQEVQYPYYNQPLRELIVRGNGSSGWDDDGRRKIYGWGLYYERLSHVQQHELEELLRYLRQLDRRLEKLNQRRGYAADLPDYVARVAEVAGVEWLVEDAGYREIFAHGFRYRAHPIGAGIDTLRGIVHRYLESGQLPGEKDVLPTGCQAS